MWWMNMLTITNSSQQNVHVKKRQIFRGMNTYPGADVIGFTETALLSSMVMVERRVRNSCLVVSSLKQRYGYG